MQAVQIVECICVKLFPCALHSSAICHCGLGMIVFCCIVVWWSCKNFCGSDGLVKFALYCSTAAVYFFRILHAGSLSPSLAILFGWW